MKKNALIIVIAVLAVVGVLFLFGQNGGQRVRIVQEGDRAPEFQLPSLDGRTVNLSSYRGKVVMVHFWATWCPPCVEEIPTLERLYRSSFGKDLEILAVSVDEGGAGAVGQFMQKNRFALPVLLNPDQSVSRSYGTLKFPETYLVDREGIVRRKIIGAADWMSPAAQLVIQAMLEK
ncbi:MAG: TlpA family protein disulfide reductase [Nitrospirae bacterium]|nr:TlpA family protein disulfide reductase [Nitrospirota bacterium]